MNCPFCKSTLLWSEDRGPHCDSCDEYENSLAAAPCSPRRIRVQLPSGGTATVTPEGANSPELLDALNTMVEAVKKTAVRRLEYPPVRVRMSRKKGWRKPPNTVYVGRPTSWGNPFVVGPERTQAEAVGAFRIWLTVDGVTAGIPDRKQWILEHLSELRGMNLACWCKPGTPCHADVLMELANAELSNQP